MIRSKIGRYTNYQEGFTLIEMLIVMTIMVVLIGMTVPAFSGLRSTIVLNESAKIFESVVRNVQRSSLLMKRDVNERWLYGVGIDLRNIETTGEYTLFKWCSPFMEYGEDMGGLDAVYTTSKLPNYDPSIELPDPLVGGDNGALPASVTWEDSCTGVPDVVRRDGVFTGMNSIISTNVEEPTLISIRELNSGQKIGFVLFESVSGRAFFYNTAGVLINYDEDGNLVDTPENLDIIFATPSRKRGLGLTVSSLSGKIFLENLDGDAISEEDFEERVNSGENVDNNDEQWDLR